MVKTWLAKIKDAIVAVRDFVDEKALGSSKGAPESRFQRFAHFWLMVAKNYSRNRCPVRAAALAYTTLLAFIPMLAVALSVTSAILKEQGEQRINDSIDRFVSNIIPPSVQAPATNSHPVVETNFAGGPTTGTNYFTNSAGTAAAVQPESDSSRQQLVDHIHQFIKNVRQNLGRSSVGALGGIAFVFIAISMLSRIEETFNDIWGVHKGRNWVARTLQYWAVITLGPTLIAAVVGLLTGDRMDGVRAALHHLPGVIAWPVSQLFPISLLVLGFGLFYLLMPNTKVHWQAALIGGITAAVLWHLNNYVSVFYVSRWVTNSKIYGSLAGIPIFMLGLYLSWVILLLGAQVAYAWQNRAAYIQEKQAENVNQRGREFIALRLMQFLGARFLRGQPPATVPEMAAAMVVPTRLAQNLMDILVAANLVVEVVIGGKHREAAYSPARPIERISCHDILMALRAGQGEELATRDDSARAGVYGEFQRILEAEKQAASTVTVLALARQSGEVELLESAGTEGSNGGSQI